MKAGIKTLEKRSRTLLHCYFVDFNMEERVFDSFADPMWRIRYKEADQRSEESLLTRLQLNEKLPFAPEKWIVCDNE